MTEKRRWKAYVAIFASTAFVSAVVTLVAIMTFDNFACRTQPQGPNDFLAYCRSLRYGDYEHGGCTMGLSPRPAKASEPRRFYFLAAAGYRLRSLRMPPESISARAASAISSWDLDMVM
jgi:hypothetical protein